MHAFSLSLLVLALLAGEFPPNTVPGAAGKQQSPRNPGTRFSSAQQVTTSSSAGVDKRIRGIALFRQGRTAEAAKVLQSAVKENKDDDTAWYYLGLALLPQRRKTKDAAKAFKTAIKLRPGFAEAHTGFAYTLLRTNKLSEALDEALAALKINPAIADAHYVIGLVRINSGDARAALVEARETIRLNPSFSEAYLLKTQALVGLTAISAQGRAGSFPSNPTITTPEERERRLQRRLETTAVLKEAGESLETYLTLNPADPSADLWREQLATLKVFGSYKGGVSSPDDVLANDEVTTKARVVTKQEPSYTESARKSQVTGTVVLRAVFSVDGKVRHILVLNGLPHGLTEQAVKTARLIKFVPAKIGDRPVSTFVQLEYNFNLY